TAPDQVEFVTDTTSRRGRPRGLTPGSNSSNGRKVGVICVILREKISSQRAASCGWIAGSGRGGRPWRRNSRADALRGSNPLGGNARVLTPPPAFRGLR